ncbi:MAG: NAD(P)/FAD-dependent oxidoreductase, partial [Acidimicrobiales bacterium]
TRRDFIGGTQIAIGAALTAPLLKACGVDPYEFGLSGAYYPPAKTGMRGSHDGSWETMHARVAGEEFDAQPIEAEYDLVVVGAGISGLSAAYLYREKHPDAKILILDNHDDFGGHAKRNEFSINGETRIGYGGTEAIDTPSHYTQEARDLLDKIGVKMDRFYDYFDQEFWDRFNLSKSILFDKETFGEEKLVRGYGSRYWAEFAADMPMSDKARADFVRVQTENKDYMPGLTFDEKYEILRKTSYENFLRNYAKVDEQVINIYKRWGMSFWCVGIDEIPTTLIQNYDGGMPGVTATLPRTGHRNDEPYIFHFPDGNASVARLLVRSMIPGAVPGSSMEDVVTAKVNYTNIDAKGQNTNIRLNSTVVDVANTKDERSAIVTYVRKGKTHTVQASKCVLACYNSAIPYICPSLPEAQKTGLAYNVKVPLVYTKVLIPNWKPFAELETDFVYYPGGFFKQVELAYPVSIGGYTQSETPDDPMILHMCHVPWIPDTRGPDQWREGRMRILTTTFEEFEGHVKTQLNQALASTGFDAEKDISAITVNRWPHGYAYNPDLIWEPDWESKDQYPWVIGRQPFGNIHIANSDAGAGADTNTAITQAYRAVQEIFYS